MAIRGFIAHNRESGAYTLTDSGRATISIGDVLKHRLEDLEGETNVLRDAYMATPWCWTKRLRNCRVF